jgi:23S rRNA (adenine2503-C2)-methyltransferase
MTQFNLTFIRKTPSKLDDAIKYVFKNADGYTVEFSFLRKRKDRYSICVPCQTMCEEQCKMCHTISHVGKIACECLSIDEMISGIDYIIEDLSLHEAGEELLISFMGMGEPLKNYENIIEAMLSIREVETLTRFAMSTSLPEKNFTDFFNMSRLIKNNKLNVKMHLSLHCSTDDERSKLMPNALAIKPSISAMRFYRDLTGNPVELQYIVNNETNWYNIIDLIPLISETNFLLKFMPLNSKGKITQKQAPDKIRDIICRLRKNFNIDSEYCISPGIDIGSSCGSFNMEEYDTP